MYKWYLNVQPVPLIKYGKLCFYGKTKPVWKTRLSQWDSLVETTESLALTLYLWSPLCGRISQPFQSWVKQRQSPLQIQAVQSCFTPTWRAEWNKMLNQWGKISSDAKDLFSPFKHKVDVERVCTHYCMQRTFVGWQKFIIATNHLV